MRWVLTASAEKFHATEKTVLFKRSRRGVEIVARSSGCSFSYKFFKQPFSMVLLFTSISFCSFASQIEEKEIAGFFSASYQQARDKFLAAAKSAGAKITHFRNPAVGAEGEALFTDVAAFNMEGAESILVVGSGTHGIEGFAGSGIQTGLLRSGFPAELKPGVGLLFYHALNPYGFSHIRRFNEDNVDVNRNFVDHSQTHPRNKGYERLAGLIEPERLTAWTKFKAQAGFAWHRLTKGRRWLQRTVSQGQYTHPLGLFYGGDSDSWSNQTLREIANRHLSRAKRVVLVDIHTGLGEYAAAELIVSERPDSPIYLRSKDWWGDLVKNPISGDSVSPPVQGALKYAFARMLPETEIIAVSLEFGTSPPLRVFWALWSENYLHHHPADPNLDRGNIKVELLRVFYPDKNDWRESVWRQGSNAVNLALKNLQ